MGGDYTHGSPPWRAERAIFERIHLNLDLSLRKLRAA
jgi:hypothetical protein